MDIALIGLLGALLGSFLTGMFGILMESHKCVSKRISLARGFRADMDTISRIAEFRGYIPAFREAAAIQQNYMINVKQNYLELFEKNCSDIGILPDILVTDVVRFYTYAKSCLEDIGIYCSAKPPPESYKAYGQLADLMEAMTEISVGYAAKVDEFIKKETSKKIYKIADWLF